MAYDNFLVDKRVVERNIAKGLVDTDELKRQIEALPDRESNCVHVSLDGTSEQPEPREELVDDEDVDDDDVEDDEDDDDDEADDEPTSQG